MIKIQYSTDRDTWQTLHDPTWDDPARMVGNARITQSIDDIDCLTFDLYPAHALYGLRTLRPIVTYVRAVDVDAGITEFDGRVVGVTSGMDDGGMMTESVTCESAEGFLLDTSIDTTAFLTGSGVTKVGDEYHMDAVAFLQAVFAQHNAMVPTVKRVALGTVDLSSGTSYIVPWTYGTVTHDLLADFVKNMRAGADPDSYIGSLEQAVAMYVHDDGNGFVCDFKDYNNGCPVSDEAINIGTNLGAISGGEQYTEIVTSVIPLGDEYTDSYGVKHRLKLSQYLDVSHTFADSMAQYYAFDRSNNIIHRRDSATAFGVIARPLQLDGLSTIDENGAPVISAAQAESFAKRAVAYLIKHAQPDESVSLTAYDLSQLGMNFDRFALFQRWPISCADVYQGILPVVRRTLDLSNPACSSLEFGKPAPREMQIRNDADKTLAKVASAVGMSDYTGAAGVNAEGANYVGEKPASGGAAPAPAPVEMSLTQYVPNWDTNGGTKPASTGIIADFETPIFFSFAQAFSSTDLQVPARTVAPLTVCMFYAGVLWQVAYGDTIGNDALMAYINGKWSQEDQRGLLSLPTLFSSDYGDIRDKDNAGTLTWEDVAGYVAIGAIAYRKSYMFPWVCNMPFVITQAEYHAYSSWGSGNIVLDCKPSTAFQWLNTTVQHPTEGAVELAWVLSCATAKLLNPTSSALGSHGSDRLVFRGFGVNNAPPEGSDPTATYPKGCMGALHNDRFSYTYTITPTNSRNISKWGCCALFRDPFEEPAHDGGNIMSTQPAARGRNIDTGAMVSLDTTIHRFIQ